MKRKDFWRKKAAVKDLIVDAKQSGPSTFALRREPGRELNLPLPSVNPVPLSDFP